jgi:glycosyltransferase involved in cell wall biosynthesis
MESLKNNARWARRKFNAKLPAPLRSALRARRIRQALHWQVMIDSIVSAHSYRPILLFMPSLSWRTNEGQLFQRPQHLASALAKAGALVFYLETTIQKPSAAFEQIEPGLVICQAPLAAFWKLPAPWGVAMTWNLPFVRGFEGLNLIYDYVDDLTAFGGSQKILREEHVQALSQAKIVLATSRRLYEDALQSRPDTLLCPNGVEFEHFHTAVSTKDEAAIPSDMLALVQSGRKIAGYYGALARWFDYELLSQLAQERPEINFVLIGSDHDQTLSASKVLDLSNVTYLGVKPYAQLPGYLRCFSAAIIPFKLNEITHATSPLKLFEYMAGGKPVVITPMEETSRYPGVLVAATAEEFSKKLDLAFQLANSAPYVKQITLLAQQNTWAMRAGQIMAAVQSKS